MNKAFDGDVAVITGAGQGIGFSIAKALALQGASVVLNDADATLANDAVARIVSAGGICAAFAGDAAELECIDGMVQTALTQFGKLTIAIANAGLSMHAGFLDFPVAQFQRLTDVNLKGTFYLVQAAANQMIKQKSSGRILLTSSVNAHLANRNLAAYAMSKAGIEMLAKNLVFELSPYQITINAIAPGATVTERTLGYNDYYNAWAAITPTGRPAVTSDVSHAALFLLSPLSGHITGQTLIVDGGWTSVGVLPPGI